MSGDHACAAAAAGSGEDANGGDRTTVVVMWVNRSGGLGLTSSSAGTEDRRPPLLWL